MDRSNKILSKNIKNLGLKVKLEGKKPIKGLLVEDKVYIEDSEFSRFLVEKGYGEKVKDKIELLPWEALYLVAEGWLEVLDEKTSEKMDVEKLVKIFSKKDESVWSKYLVYRDLRSRGYVVKLGFGQGIDFRVYERGTYGKEAAKFLVCSVFEGEPIPIKNLVKILESARSLKKEVVIGVIERRGEVVYYSLSKFNL